LGARNERGPGVHIYPSVAAQLSIARDAATTEAPRRGSEVIDLGHPDLLASFLDDTGPTERSSTVLLAEPGTRHTYLALRFLAAGHRNGDTTLMVSTKEDQDALRRICSRQPLLRDTSMQDGDFAPGFRVLYLHPEFISAGKFTWDFLQQTLPSDGDDRPVTRVAFDSIYRLGDRFPLLEHQHFMIPALIDILRYRSVTPLFVDLVPPGSATRRSAFNPAPYLTTFDNVFHLYLEDDEGTPRPYLRVLKSTANEFTRNSIPFDYERS
ncbi:MAG: hypothetical protein KDB80_00575, partial [Planctomycetes bacterium]|nr:hypothetical protein [Planctomycetota bacterium]